MLNARHVMPMMRRMSQRLILMATCSQRGILMGRPPSSWIIIRHALQVRHARGGGGRRRDARRPITTNSPSLPAIVTNRG